MRYFLLLLLFWSLSLVGTCFGTDDYWKAIEALADLDQNDERVIRFWNTGDLPQENPLPRGHAQGGFIAPASHSENPIFRSSGASSSQHTVAEASGSQQRNVPFIDLTGHDDPGSSFSHPNPSSPQILTQDEWQSVMERIHYGRNAEGGASASHQHSNPVSGSALPQSSDFTVSRLPESIVLPVDGMPPSLTVEGRQSILTSAFLEISQSRKGPYPIVVYPFRGNSEVMSQELVTETLLAPRALFRKIRPGIFAVPIGRPHADRYYSREQGGMNLGLQSARNQLFVWRTFERQGDQGTFLQLIGALELATTADVAKAFMPFNMPRTRASVSIGSDWVYSDDKLVYQVRDSSRFPS